jgi:ketosteroid isomerase-like protein
VSDIPSSEAAAPILRVLDDYKAAVLAKDVDAFIALYADEVRVFDLWAEWSYDGVAAWRTTAGNWFASLGTQRVIVEFTDVRTTMAQGLATAHGFVSYQAISEDGVALHSMNNRMTMVLKQQDREVWKIVHEHTSAPVANDTMKVILKR